MIDRQLSLRLEERAGRPAGRLQRWRGSRARWWFAQMRQAVECAVDWEPQSTSLAPQSILAKAGVSVSKPTNNDKVTVE